MEAPLKGLVALLSYPLELANFWSYRLRPSSLFVLSSFYPLLHSLLLYLPFLPQTGLLQLSLLLLALSSSF